MIQVKDIPFIAGRYAIGDRIPVVKMISSEKNEKVDAEIIGKYPHFVLVREIRDDRREEDRMKWSIQWKDFALTGRCV